MSKYSEKLRDPRWQKKRLGVLERAGWKCDKCRNDKETLQVHHLIYSKGEPWDAPDETLECLCESCHEWREEFNRYWGGRCLQSTLFCAVFMTVLVEAFSGKLKLNRTSSLEKFCGSAWIENRKNARNKAEQNKRA